MKTSSPHRAGAMPYAEAAECLKVIAHPHRLEMIELMLQAPRSVGMLAERCGIRENVASQHLNLMKRCGFLTARKVGRVVIYDVVEPHLAELLDCMRRRFARPLGAASRRKINGR